MHDHDHENPALTQTPTLFGHPVGLYTLFFAEMWERFCFYGMRALLVLYMGKEFLKYDDTSANAMYGAFTAMVYMTPFLGGILADRLLGQRRAVVLGGMLMAAGELLMMVPQTIAFFTALALLICRKRILQAQYLHHRRFTLSAAAVPAATADLRFSTWASTSVRRSPRCCVAISPNIMATTGVSAWPRSA